MQQDYGSVESNPYQRGWFVPNDIKGMLQLMGGDKKVIADLTSLFKHTPKNMMWSDYYNHANEPVYHVSFLFNRLQAPWLIKKWSRAICRRAYHDGVAGRVGNEDVGQMSAWYILPAGGIYPIAFGSPPYEIASPMFSKFVIPRDPRYTSGIIFTIMAKNNSLENIYLQSATLNGKPWPYCFITHTDIANGGILQLQMSKRPHENWGKSE